MSKIIDLKNGYTEERRLCGDLERTDIVYKEGCDFLNVPQDQKICYCKQNLCNYSPKIKAKFFVIISTTVFSTYLFLLIINLKI